MTGSEHVEQSVGVAGQHSDKAEQTDAQQRGAEARPQQRCEEGEDESGDGQAQQSHGRVADAHSGEFEAFGGDGEDDEAGHPSDEIRHRGPTEPHEARPGEQGGAEGLDEDGVVEVASEQRNVEHGQGQAAGHESDLSDDERGRGQQHDGPEPEESGREEADRFRQCHGALEGDDGAEETEDHGDAVQIGQIVCAHRSPDSEEEQGGVEAGEHGQSGGDEEGETADHCSTPRPDFGVSAVAAVLSCRCRRQAPGSEKGSSSLSAAGSPKTSRAPRTSPRWTPQTMSGCSWAASSSGHRVSRKLCRSVGASTLGDASSPTGSGANPSSSSRVTDFSAAEIPSGAEELAASPSPRPASASAGSTSSPGSASAAARSSAASRARSRPQSIPAAIPSSRGFALVRSICAANTEARPRYSEVPVRGELVARYSQAGRPRPVDAALVFVAAPASTSWSRCSRKVFWCRPVMAARAEIVTAPA